MALVLGGKTRQRLSLGMVYRELLCRLRFTLNVPTASNTTANTFRGDEWSLISKLSVVGNSADVLREYSGDYLRMRNLIYGMQNPITPTIGDGSATYNAGATVDSSIIIPFWSVGAGKRPMDTALDSAKYTDLALEVTCNPLASAVNTAAVSITNVTLDLHSYEHDSDPTKGNDPFGPRGSSLMLRKEVVAQQVLSNSDVRVDLRIGPVYAGIWINIRDTSVPTLDSGTICTNIKVISGTNIYYDRPWVVAVMETQAYGFDGAGMSRFGYDASGNTLTTSTPWRNGKETMAGWVYVDFAPDGYYTEGIDTDGFGEFFMLLTCNAAGTAFYCPVELYPPRVPRVAAAHS
jgi:hypothetical protein